MNEIELSSGNVFADLALPDATALDLRVQLAIAVNRRIRARRLTNFPSTRKLAISQQKLSAIHRYRLASTSTDQLLKILTLLGCDIEIRVRTPSRCKDRGRIIVTETGRQPTTHQ
jgi:predicted XRE-type DNA-binding protein